MRLESDRIEVDGQPVATAAKIYLMLNKPRGVVTTASDEKGRQTVYEFLDSALPWVAPVGRLDKASEGLLLLTNDSEWAAQVMAPASHLNKTYHVQIDRVADTALLESISKGVRTEEGDFLRVVERSHPARRQAQYLARNCFGRRQEPSHSAHAGSAWRCRAAPGAGCDWPAAARATAQRECSSADVEEKQAIDKALRDHSATLNSAVRPVSPAIPLAGFHLKIRP